MSMTERTLALLQTRMQATTRETPSHHLQPFIISQTICLNQSTSDLAVLQVRTFATPVRLIDTLRQKPSIKRHSIRTSYGYFPNLEERRPFNRSNMAIFKFDPAVEPFVPGATTTIFELNPTATDFKPSAMYHPSRSAVEAALIRPLATRLTSPIRNKRSRQSVSTLTTRPGAQSYSTKQWSGLQPALPKLTSLSALLDLPSASLETIATHMATIDARSVHLSDIQADAHLASAVHEKQQESHYDDRSGRTATPCRTSGIHIHPLSITVQASRSNTQTRRRESAVLSRFQLVPSRKRVVRGTRLMSTMAPKSAYQNLFLPSYILIIGSVREQFVPFVFCGVHLQKSVPFVLSNHDPVHIYERLFDAEMVSRSELVLSFSATKLYDTRNLL